MNETDTKVTDGYVLYDPSDNSSIANPSHNGTSHGANCYGTLESIDRETFLTYDKILGGYFICIIGGLGLIGNTLSILVLLHKEMRKNCFSQLLMGNI